MNQYDFLFKFIMIGDTGVGKSCMLLRFVDDRFREDYDATIGVEFGSKLINIDNLTIKIQIWDTAGQESFRSITRSYYKGAIGAIVMYDITKRSSFDNLPKWIHDIKDQGKQDAFITIVGNKYDQSSSREVSSQEASAYAESINCNYCEVSAKNGDNVNQVFMNIAKEIIVKIQTNQIDFSSESTGIKVGSKKSPPIVDNKGNKGKQSKDKENNQYQKLNKDKDNNDNSFEQEQQSYCRC